MVSCSRAIPSSTTACGHAKRVPSSTSRPSQALNAPPFDGEAVYHASKAFLEGFSNSLRMETTGADIKVMTLRPGCVVTHFHLQRVKYDQDAMDEFLKGYEPLVAEDLADSVLYMLSLPDRVTVKALDCVPTGQRALTRFDREWNDRRK